MAQPVFSGADESQHAEEAEAVFSGQFLPRLDSDDNTAIEPGLIRVPLIANGSGCFVGQAAVSAACDAITMSVPAKSGFMDSYISREPPLPALLSGLPLYIDPGPVGFYLSRVVTTLLASALIAAAIALAASRGRFGIVCGVLVAMAPSAVAEFGVLGSSQLEVGLASLMWVSLALLATGEPVSGRLAGTVSGSAALLALSRPISFVFVGLAIVVAALCGGRALARDMLASAGGRTGLGALAATMGGAVAWFGLANAPVNPRYMADLHLPVVHSIADRIVVASQTTPVIWAQLIGATGSNEYNGPAMMTILWTMLAGAIVLFGLLLAGRRLVLSVLALLAALLALPTAAQVLTMPRMWLYWQGRYSLPVFSGLVIMASSAMDRALARQILGRLVTITAILAGALQFVELVWTLHRYVVGVNGQLDPLKWSAGWQPPIPSVAILVLGAAAVGCAYSVPIACHRRAALREPKAPSQASTGSAC